MVGLIFSTLVHNDHLHAIQHSLLVRLTSYVTLLLNICCVHFRLGAHYRTNGSVATEQEVAVAKIIKHENYSRPLSESNDIALMKLAKPAALGRGIGLVCMPNVSHPLPFDNNLKKCWITGWGTLTYQGSSPNVLMEAPVPLVSRGRCVRAYPHQIDNTMLCAGRDQGGVDSCQGDSGGPLVCEFNNTWFLEGITSWGYKCASPGKYGVYTYVRNFIPWVSKNMNQSKYFVEQLFGETLPASEIRIKL